MQVYEKDNMKKILNQNLDAWRNWRRILEFSAACNEMNQANEETPQV